jgi:CheY-like chemotaxis protein
VTKVLPGVADFPSRHILLIEDNPDGRETLQALLELLGHRVEAAADGTEGVAKALTGRPEIIVTDIGLPGLDGYQVARQLRAALGRSVFLIALTAYGQPEDRRLAAEAGFDVFLVKPVDLGELSYWLTEVPPGPWGGDGVVMTRSSSSGSTGLGR